MLVVFIDNVFIFPSYPTHFLPEQMPLIKFLKRFVGKYNQSTGLYGLNRDFTWPLGNQAAIGSGQTFFFAKTMGDFLAVFEVVQP